MIHVCNIQHGAGPRLRILAARENCGPVLADYHVFVISQVPGEWPKIAGEGMLKQFARAMGAEGVFASVLSRASASQEVVDEQGVVVPMPEMTVDDWRERSRLYYAWSIEAAERVLQLTGAESPKM